MARATTQAVARPRATASERTPARQAWVALAGGMPAGLLALIAIAGTALSNSTAVSLLGPYVGFALGGAVVGLSVALWAKGVSWQRAALGFALGFQAPAVLVAPVLERTFAALGEPTQGVGTMVTAAFAFGISYGVGGAIGGAFVAPRLFWSIGWCYGAAGALGGMVAAAGSGGVLIAIVAAMAGHMIPFMLGGFLAGYMLDLRAARGSKR